MSRHDNLYDDDTTGCLAIIGLIILIFAIIFVEPLVAMWLWNAIMVPVFTAPVLGYWQTFGLSVLIHLLFPGKINIGRK